VHNAPTAASVDASTAVAAFVTATTIPAIIVGDTAAVPTSAIAAAVTDGSPV